MSEACRACRDALLGVSGMEDGTGEVASAEEHARTCEACAAWLRRFERQGAALRSLRRLTAPRTLEGMVVAATQAGCRQDRAVGAISALERLDPEEAEQPSFAAENSPLAQLAPKHAPADLLGRVEDELAEPAETVVARQLGRLTRLAAPAELERRVVAARAEAPGSAFGSTPWMLAGLASAAVLILASVLWNDRRVLAQPPTMLAIESADYADVRVAALADTEELVLPVEVDAVRRALPKSAAHSLLGALAVASDRDERARRTDPGLGDANPRVPLRPNGMTKHALDPYVHELLVGSAAAAVQQPYLGTRVVRTRPVDGPLFGYPPSQVWALRERVGSDGTGRFGFDSHELIEPSLDPQLQGLYLGLQEERQGMHFRYRDFRVRDVDLLEQNYKAVLVGPTMVAGRPCEQVSIERKPVAYGTHWVDFDLETGLVLRASFTDPTGEVRHSMEFETIDIRPNLTSLPFHQPANDERVLAAGVDLLDYFGFEPVEPVVLPVGYEQIEQSAVYDPLAGSDWHKRTYSDGIEVLFFLHGGEYSPGLGAETWPGANDFLMVVRASEWSALQGNARGERVLAVGQLPEDELVEFVESSLR